MLLIADEFKEKQKHVFLRSSVIGFSDNRQGMLESEIIIRSIYVQTRDRIDIKALTSSI